MLVITDDGSVNLTRLVSSKVPAFNPPSIKSMIILFQRCQAHFFVKTCVAIYDICVRNVATTGLCPIGSNSYGTCGVIKSVRKKINWSCAQLNRFDQARSIINAESDKTPNGQRISKSLFRRLISVEWGRQFTGRFSDSLSAVLFWCSQWPARHRTTVSSQTIMSRS